jgi:primosomal protein N' (replication factor Y)
MHHVLPRRAGNSELPGIRALDVRKQNLQAGLSAELLNTMESTLDRGKQVLLFLNRRGYAPTLQCHDCGWIAECRSCDARLTVHLRQKKLRCHHCTSRANLPRACPECQSRALMAAGLGTEQTEGFLRGHFPGWPIHRVDSDSMTAKNAMQDLVTEILKGEPAILLGTQMLTKGHHFPGVSLVAVIDVDSALFSTDFRGEERMAQMLTQVGGRAGRAESKGEVILQTHYPDHPALQAILHKPYAEHARDILDARQAASMPPTGKLLMLRTDSADVETGEQFLTALRQRAEPQLAPNAKLIGPLPSPMQRRAGKFRSQLLVTVDSHKSAQYMAALLVSIAESLPIKRGMKWSIDVDPQDTF